MVEKIKEDPGFASNRIFSDSRLGFELKGELEKIPTEGFHVSFADHKNFLFPNIAKAYGLSFMQGGLGLGMQSEKIWSDNFARASTAEKIKMLEQANVRYVITTETLAQGEGKFRYKPTAQLVKLKNTLERVFLVPSAKQEKENAILEQIRSESFDPRSEVLLSDPVAWSADKDYEGRILDVTYHPNRIRVLAEQSNRGVLVLLDSFFPGWRVRVDGEEKQILRANYFFRAVHLDPGRHEVEFFYEPVGLKEGLWVSGFSLLVLVALFLGIARRPRGTFGPGYPPQGCASKR